MFFFDIRFIPAWPSYDHLLHGYQCYPGLSYHACLFCLDKSVHNGAQQQIADCSWVLILSSESSAQTRIRLFQISFLFDSWNSHLWIKVKMFRYQKQNFCCDENLCSSHHLLQEFCFLQTNLIRDTKFCCMQTISRLYVLFYTFMFKFPQLIYSKQCHVLLSCSDYYRLYVPVTVLSYIALYKLPQIIILCFVLYGH